MSLSCPRELLRTQSAFQSQYSPKNITHIKTEPEAPSSSKSILEEHIEERLLDLNNERLLCLNNEEIPLQVMEYDCPRCEKTQNFNKNVNELYEHDILCKEPFKCRFCRLEIVSYNKYIRHLKCKHVRNNPKKGVYLCLYCRKKYDYLDSLENHILVTHLDIVEVKEKWKNNNKALLQCDKCFVQCFNKKSLTQHIHHCKKIYYTCKFCNEKIVFKFNYLRHLRKKHNKYDVFHCNVCSQTFKSVVQLKKHAKLCNSIKKTSLKINVDNSLKCKNCNQIFLCIEHLNIHSKLCTQVYCKMCDCVFLTKTELSKHIFESHNEDENEVITEVSGMEKIDCDVTNCEVISSEIQNYKDYNTKNFEKVGQSEICNEDNNMEFVIANQTCIKCSICDLNCDSISNFQEHVKCHSITDIEIFSKLKEGFNCNFCTFSLHSTNISAVSIIQHILTCYAKEDTYVSVNNIPCINEAKDIFFVKDDMMSNQNEMTVKFIDTINRVEVDKNLRHDEQIQDDKESHLDGILHSKIEIDECDIRDTVHDQDCHISQTSTMKIESEYLIGVESSSCDVIGVKEIKQEELDVPENMPQFETYFVPEFNEKFETF